MAGYVSKAFTPIENNPPNSADVEAAKTLRAHVGTGIKSTPARVSPGRAKTKPGQATGRKVGPTKLSGGRG